MKKCNGTLGAGHDRVIAKTPIVRENGHLRDMPSRALYIVEAIIRQRASTLPQLQQETRLNRERLEEQLSIL